MSESYKKVPKKSAKDIEEAERAQYARTVARLKSVTQHFEEDPRGGSLEGKVCIVTGVGSLKGIGRAAVLLFAREGARHIYALDFAGENLPNLTETITTKYRDVKVTTVQGDASDDQTIKSLCEKAVSEEGRLDVFFANAGIATGSLLEKTSADEWNRTMRINALSTFLATKYGSIAMKVTGDDKTAPGGSILMTASVAGIRSGAGSSDYSASKAAVISLAKTAAHQLGPYDIRVNSISPGLIETGMTTATFDYARSRNTAGKIGQLSPMARFGVAEEVANVALFLASDASSYVTGQNIAVDGGLSALHPVRPGKFY